MKRFNIALFFIIIIVLIGIVIAYFGPVIFKKPAEEKTRPVETTSLSRVAVAKAVIESIDTADISSKVIGLIQKITVAENEDVKKGQTLIILDSKEAEAKTTEAEASVKKAIADYEKARTNYERYERLYKNSAVTLDEMENSTRLLKSTGAELAGAHARLEYAKTFLRNFTLKSPIDGIVTKKYLEEGEVAREGNPILSVADMNNLKVKAEVDETDVGKIYVGQRVEVLADAYPGRIYNGKVTKVSEDVKRKVVKTYDPIAWMDINSQEVTIHLDSFEGLKIGMTVDARFYSEKQANR